MKLLLAGGGTGGHLFSGVAVAEEFLEKYGTEDSEVMFVGGKYGLDERILSKLPYRYRLINVRGIKGRGIAGLAISLFMLPLSLIRSIAIVLEFRPDMVLGVGGYVSGPVLLAARFLGLKVAVIEQNSVPGMTNRLIAKFASRIFVVFDNKKAWNQPGKLVLTGNPCRSDIARIAGKKKNEKDGKFRILVTGGSQGAVRVNELVSDAYGILSKEFPDMRLRHQTGTRDIERMRKMYEDAAGVEVTAFIDDMSEAYAWADMVICRAGAGNLTEVAAAAKAAIVIPFPYAADNHQEKNARYLADMGALVWMKESELTGEKLASKIREFYINSDMREDLASKVGAFYRVDAAKVILEELAALR